LFLRHDDGDVEQPGQSNGPADAIDRPFDYPLVQLAQEARLGVYHRQDAVSVVDQRTHAQARALLRSGALLPEKVVER
jgi:hypothetical protein